MIIVTENEVWADTVGVQAAVTMFQGKHIGFGNFVLPYAGPSRVSCVRYDGTQAGRAMRKQYGFLSRPYVLKGAPKTVSVVVAALEKAGHPVIHEEE